MRSDQESMEEGTHDAENCSTTRCASKVLGVRKKLRAPEIWSRHAFGVTFWSSSSELLTAQLPYVLWLTNYFHWQSGHVQTTVCPFLSKLTHEVQ